MPKTVEITEDNCWEAAGISQDEPAPTPASYSTGSGNFGKPFDVPAFCAKYGIIITSTGTTGDGRTRFVLESCIFDPAHTAPDAAIMQEPSGRLNYHCFHASCSNYKWTDVREKFEPARDRIKQSANAIGTAGDATNGKPHGTAEERAARLRTWVPNLLTAAEFNAGDYRQEYLVSRVLVRHQAFIIGGQSKTLKTSTLIDLILSLGTFGQQFLGHFPVTRPSRSLFLSGESGEFTLQETLRRVAKSKDIDPAAANCMFGFTLPAISSGIDMTTLAKVIADNGIDVAIIDPLYLCLIAGSATPVSTSNVFQMGPLLRELTTIGQETGCTMGICHHTTKRIERPGEAPTLEDLSMAGVAEWARQWLLIGRRERYEDGSGLHKLLMRVGGSAGHSGLYAVDVDEGKLGDDFTGREWNVAVSSAIEARAEGERQKQAEKDTKAKSKLSADMALVKAALERFPAGETTKVLRETNGMRVPDTNQAIAELLRNGAIERCNVIKSNRKAPYEGYRIKRETTPEMLTLLPPE